MKQSLLILAAATAVAFAACNGGNNEGSYTQAQVDSIAKVKSDSIAAALKAQTDSTIAATAAAEARSADSLRVIDSIIAATKKTTPTTVGKKTGGKKGTTAPTKEEPKVEPKPQIRTAEDIKRDKKAAEFGDAAAKARLEQDKRNKKAAEFGDKNAQERLDETKSSKKADEFK
jgi:hypothetical protein